MLNYIILEIIHFICILQSDAHKLYLIKRVRYIIHMPVL